MKSTNVNLLGKEIGQPLYYLLTTTEVPTRVEIEKVRKVCRIVFKISWLQKVSQITM